MNIALPKQLYVENFTKSGLHQITLYVYSLHRVIVLMTSCTCILGSTRIAKDMTTVFIYTLIEVEVPLLHLRVYSLI